MNRPRLSLHSLLLLLTGLVLLAALAGAVRLATGAAGASAVVETTAQAFGHAYQPLRAQPSGLPSPTRTPSRTRTPTATSTPTTTRTPTRTRSPTTPATATQPPSSGSFWGANGGPIDGGNSPRPYDGNLSHNAPLRAKSFFWLRQSGLGWFRNYGSDGIVYSWIFVEPAPGAYDWSAWDLLVREAQKQGVTLLPNIGNGVPQWANGSSNWRDPPLDLLSEPVSATLWYQFVRAFVERYDGDGVQDMPGLTAPIKYWEIWNEPDLRQTGNPPDFPAHQFAGSVIDYVRLLEVAYAAVKAADPDAMVVGPATAQWPGNTVADPWFLWTWEDFMAAGGLNYVDIVSFHRFFTPTAWDANGVVDSVLDQVDANRGGKPVWLTESGWDGNATDNYQLKGRNLVRSTVIVWARPFVNKYFWYSFQESETFNGYDHKGFIQTLNGSAAKGAEPDPLFHPVFRVAEVMTRVLAAFDAGAHPVALDGGPDARLYQFSASGVQVWVAWHRADTGSSTLTLDTGGQTTRVIGLYGEDLGTFVGGPITVGPMPVYLTTDLNWSANLGTITGRVRDGNMLTYWNNGRGGITVRLTGPVNANTLTDAVGNYVFENLPEGSYVVRVSGYTTTPASRKVVVARESLWGRTSFTIIDPANGPR